MQEFKRDPRVTSRWPVGLIAYLVIGLGWFLFLVFASRVKTVEPVFLWVLTQGLLVEKISGGGPADWVILLIAYMGAGWLAWLIVERSNRDPALVWRRAFFSWLAIQAIYCLVATLLVQGGILYE
jgi:hypothetical protein